MALEAKHITALTEAMATGCTVPINGKDLVFAPLDFGDMGDILQFNKSQAVQSYLMGIEGLNTDRAERLGMLYGLQMRGARNEDFIPNEPSRMVMMVWLSLRHAQPNITKAQVAELCQDKLRCDLIADVVNVISRGPAGDPNDPLAEQGSPETTQTSNP